MPGGRLRTSPRSGNGMVQVGEQQRHCFETPAVLYAALAEALLAEARNALAARGSFHLVLAGGNTPRPLYEKLAAAPFRDALDWSRIHLWFGDERCVPPDSPRSNYRMVEQVLLRHVPLPAENIHRMHGEAPPPVAADDYQRALLEQFGTRPAALDLVLLGVGDDGHTASLFPRTEVLRQRHRQVCAQYVEAHKEWRLTLTLPVLEAAKKRWILACGAAKADIIERALTGPYQPEILPIQFLTRSSGPTEWWLDAAAGRDLSRNHGE